MEGISGLSEIAGDWTRPQRSLQSVLDILMHLSCCGVSFSGDIPDLPGHGAVQPALGDPAWAGGWTG